MCHHPVGIERSVFPTDEVENQITRTFKPVNVNRYDVLPEQAQIPVVYYVTAAERVQDKYCFVPRPLEGAFCSVKSDVERAHRLLPFHDRPGLDIRRSGLCIESTLICSLDPSEVRADWEHPVSHLEEGLPDLVSALEAQNRPWVPLFELEFFLMKISLDVVNRHTNVAHRMLSSLELPERSMPRV